MRFRIKSECQRIAEHRELVRRRSAWHRWFAWYPVQLANGDLAWLETIWRRGIYNPDGTHFCDNPWAWFYNDEKGG